VSTLTETLRSDGKEGVNDQLKKSEFFHTVELSFIVLEVSSCVGREKRDERCQDKGNQK